MYSDSFSVSLFYLKSQVLCANVYHRSLVNKTFFLYPQKHVLCPQVSPRSITDWFGFGLGWFGEFNTWCFSKRLLNEFPEWLLFNCRNPIDHSLWSNCDRVSMRSLVVVEETNMVFHTKLLQFSIFQLLECNKLEVSLEE